MAAGEELRGADRVEIDRAIRAAEQSCRFEFSVYIGKSDGDPHAYARRLHSALVAPARSLLILVDPGSRALEVVTGREVRRNLRDAEAELAVLSMQTAFAEGDFVGGLVRGINQLADHARS